MAEISKITCPFCDHELEFEALAEINVSNDPSLKQEVLNFNLFKLECEHCHKTIPIVFDTLYHDFNQKLMVFLTSQEINDSFLEQLNQQVADEFGDLSGYQLRVVDNPDALREKIILRDLRLDDRLIELAKFYYSMLALEQNKEIQIQQVLFVHHVDQENELGFILKDQRTFKSELKQAVLDKFKEVYAPYLAFEETGFEWIDVAWANKMIQIKH